ncbi:imelysin family protein [Sneathiella marina]|uniref:Imelysin family protein n=1 Tax=Sneathiella marina TaxID=2950108 RepID=A0ABY4W4M9_9PROT|nr:imelysin family protein [Sneathiella marina]USG60842.1 imelysin family protein [Sneathiella marina]
MIIRSTLGALATIIGFSAGLSSVAHADDNQERLFTATIEHFVNDFAIPTYFDFMTSTIKLDQAVDNLCEKPTAATLTSAKAAFRSTVLSWSAAEVIRFGPIRQENRLERVFYWPDTRSRGLKKVQSILAGGSILKDTKLESKSVAIQGLPALEYLLFGANSEGLTDAGSSAARCNFSKAITSNLMGISQSLYTEWESPNGYQVTLTSPKTTNGVFRSNGEVIQEILKSAAELIELVSKAKLQSPLGKSMEEVKPKRAAFWRSELTLENIQTNVASVVNLQNLAEFAEMLPASERGYSTNLIFDAKQINAALSKLIQSKVSWNSITIDAKMRELLLYIVSPLQGIKDILSIYYPEILGLQLGFNSLDGD